jgi:hypothetical protein
MCTADCYEVNNLTADCYEENNRTADFQEENNLTADCNSQESKFESGMPRGYSCCGKPRCTLKAVCQGVIPVVANRGTILSERIRIRTFINDCDSQ